MTPAEVLALEHGCWTEGNAPSGAPVPTHAVVTLPGRAPAYVPAQVGFAIWLGPDGVADTGDEKPGVLTAFCP